MVEYILQLSCLTSLISTCIATPAPHNVTEVNLELDLEFRRLDLNKNGLVDIQEYDNIMKYWDNDNDGCVTTSEFYRAHQSDSLELEWALYKHYDHNEDGCLEVQDLTNEFHEMDISPKDGKVTVQELEAYYDELLLKIGFLRVSALSGSF